MKNIVHWRFMDSTIEGTVLSGRELWAMSLHDKIIQRTVDEFYDELMENKVQTLLSCYSKADIGSIRELVKFLAIMSEGTIVLYQTCKEQAEKLNVSLNLQHRFSNLFSHTFDIKKKSYRL